MQSFIYKIYSVLFDTKYIKGAIILLVLAFIGSCYQRELHIDENWFGEEAYWLLKEGAVKLKSIEGFRGFDERIYVYHKLFIWIGAGIISIFGWSVYPLKIFTFLAFCLFLLPFKKFIEKEFSKDHFWFALFFLLLNPLIVIFAFTFRPEILIMSLAFSSFFFLNQHLNTGKTIFIFIAGILGGLTFLTHLNGLVYLPASVVLLLWNRRYKEAAIFTVVFLAVASIYFIELLNDENLRIYIDQLTRWPHHNFGKKYPINNIFSLISRFVINLLNEQSRFFWSEKVSFFSALFFLCYIFNFKKLYHLNKNLLIYTALIVLGLGAYSNFKSQGYLLQHYPFMAAIIGITIHSLFKEKKPLLKSLLNLLLVVQLSLTGKVLFTVYSNNSDFQETHKEILAQLPDQKGKVIGPWFLIFDELPNYDFINYETFKYHEEDINKKLSQTEFYKRAVELNAKYIILDEAIRNDKAYKWFWKGEIEENPYFEVIIRDENYLVLERI